MSTKPIEPQFFSRKEVSQLTGISIPALSRMAREHRGPKCIMLEGFSCSFYPIDETKAWLRGCSNGTSGRGGVRASSKKPKRKGRHTKAVEIAKRKRPITPNHENASGTP